MRGGGYCPKRSQFPPGPGGTGPEGRGARDKDAKRTQFGTRCPEMGAGRLAGDLQRGPIMQNEPNVPGGAGRLSFAPRPSGLAPTGPMVQNEPNFAAVPGRTGQGAIMRNEANCGRGFKFEV
jgi:hypothetical protein